MEAAIKRFSNIAFKDLQNIYKEGKSKGNHTIFKDIIIDCYEGGHLLVTIHNKDFGIKLIGPICEEPHYKNELCIFDVMYKNCTSVEFVNTIHNIIENWNILKIQFQSSNYDDSDKFGLLQLSNLIK